MVTMNCLWVTPPFESNPSFATQINSEYMTSQRITSTLQFLRRVTRHICHGPHQFSLLQSANLSYSGQCSTNKQAAIGQLIYIDLCSVRVAEICALEAGVSGKEGREKGKRVQRKMDYYIKLNGKHLNNMQSTTCPVAITNVRNGSPQRWPIHTLMSSSTQFLCPKRQDRAHGFNRPLLTPDHRGSHMPEEQASFFGHNITSFPEGQPSDCTLGPRWGYTLQNPWPALWGCAQGSSEGQWQSTSI